MFNKIRSGVIAFSLQPKLPAWADAMAEIGRAKDGSQGPVADLQVNRETPQHMDAASLWPSESDTSSSRFQHIRQQGLHLWAVGARRLKQSDDWPRPSTTPCRQHGPHQHPFIIPQIASIQNGFL